MQKKLIFLVVFILITLINYRSYSNDLYFQRMNTDFNGVIAYDNNVICYGEYGVLTYSTDKGTTWRQQNIGDKYNILKIVRINNELVGITNNSVIVSRNKGLNWSIIDFDNSLPIKSVELANNQLFVLSEKDLYKLNANYKFEKFDEFEDDYISMIYHKEKLFFTSREKQINKYNIENKQMEELPISLPDTCVNCQFNLQMFSSDERIFIELERFLQGRLYGGSIIQSTDEGDSWTVFANWLETKDYYFIENEKVYNLETMTFRTPSENSTDTLRGKFYVGFNMKEVIGSLNYDYKSEEFSRLSRFIPEFSRIKIKEIVRIDNEKLIAVANSKFILISNNNGIDWELVSYLYGIVSDNFQFINANIVRIISNNTFFETTDGGVTWLPFILNPTTNQVNGSFKFVINNSKGSSFIHFSRNLNDNGVLYGPFNLIISEDSQELIDENRFGGLIMNTNYAISRDIEFGAEHLISMRARDANNFFSQLAIFDNDFNYIDSVRFDSTNVRNIYKGKNDTIFALFTFLRGDYRDANNMLKFKEDDTFLQFSTDFGRTWQIRNSSPKLSPNVIGSAVDKLGSYIAHNKVFLHTDVNAETAIVHIPEMNYHSQDMCCSEIYWPPISKPRNIENKFFEFDNKLFFVSEFGNLFYNPDFLTNPMNWDSLSLNKFLYDYVPYYENQQRIGNSMILDVKSFDSIAYLVVGKTIWDVNPLSGLERERTKKYLVKISKDSPSSVENAELETPRSRAFLHAGKPYPLPAVSTVSSDLHWNAQYSAQEAVLKVFDSMGNEIPNAQVELQQTNPYSGTVTWDCGAYPTGVYFIQVTIGTEQKNVGVAVVR